ncbi:hypothetical protein K491DRAFT_704075 [Lophiostoma macrostomum CBS 122681]|uniref:Xylanolytic transcriptional activator regulatory domain-containing protein n=1 Tax=Lophiostoma macrostomum CBS 122681 TaxID=1314788 RepID=A0A6A6T936_9PLEO|nr:hypothetical protein K491DRAFT_704075 [Lophiostoma macrostomum CBS 122681]
MDEESVIRSAPTETPRRRRRPAVRKVRCNRDTPCSNCVRAKASCVYENFSYQSRDPGSADFDSLNTLSHQGQSILNPGHPVTIRPAATIPDILTTSSSPSNHASPAELVSMRKRIQQLEDQLSRASLRTHHTHLPSLDLRPDSKIESSTSTMGGTFYVRQESRMVGRSQAISRTVLHKTRLFGQSHWVNGLAFLRDLIEIADPLMREEASRVNEGIAKCKALSRLIKSLRKPPWPTQLDPTLPPKQLADELVECYLRTSETVYRIIHIPSFRKDYDALWTDPSTPNPSFLIQLKLVLAMGSATYDETYSLRTSALKWVHEALTWASEPIYKARLNLQTLQTKLLLLLARSTLNIGGDFVWTSAGELLRTAITMGLHRDPSRLPKRTLFAVEMRRRLWNTLIEINLQSAMDVGGPPLFALSDYDTEMPGNYDDAQLSDSSDTTEPHPASRFTQTSLAIALRETLPTRIAVAAFLNDLGPQVTYEEALRLDAEMRSAYKTLSQTIRTLSASASASTSTFTSTSGSMLDVDLASTFGVRVLDFVNRYYLLAIHIPWINSASRDPAYAYSRTVGVETSLKLWYAVYPPRHVREASALANISSTSASVSSTAPTTAPASALGEDDQNPASIRAKATNRGQRDILLITLNTSLFLRTIAVQASLFVCMDLRMRLQDDDSLSPQATLSNMRADLLAVAEDHREWQLRAIQGGETNIKGYLLASLVDAFIKGLIRRVPSGEVPGMLVKAAEEAEDECVAILEGMVGGLQGETVGGGGVGAEMEHTPEDWDFLMSDAQFDFGGGDLMNWVFNVEGFSTPFLSS